MQIRRMIAALGLLAVLMLCLAPVSTARAWEHGASGIGMHGADMEELSRPDQVSMDLASFTFIVFLILLAILWKFAWGPIAAGLEKREHSIADNIAAAQRQHEESKALLAQYEAKLDSAADEVRKILDEARRDAEQVKQSVLAEAKSGAEAERLRSLHEIETATDAALQSLAERSAKLAVELAGKIVRTSLKASDHERLIQEAVEKFPTTVPSNN